MRILIDGYNLLHASTVTPTAANQGSLEATRNALLDHLLEYLPPGMASETVVVFDKGSERDLPAESRYGELTIRFAINHPEADDLIEQLIREDSTPKRLTVVSSDHRLHRAANRRKATPIDSEDWLANLLQNANRSAVRPEGPPLVSGDWKAEFADIDLDAIEREVAAESTGPLPQPPAPEPDRAANVTQKPPTKKPEFDNPFPPGYGEDLLEGEANDSPFPEGYGEDLL
jgi:predicted RNA-binding protein with PIN domain